MNATTMRFDSTVGRSLVAACAGGMLQGGWAMFANWDQPGNAYLIAGSVQGASSFGMTLVITIVMDLLLVFFGSIERQPVRYVLSLGATVLFMTTVYVVGQSMAGTHDVWLTIGPALGIGTLYCGIYLFARTSRLVSSP